VWQLVTRTDVFLVRYLRSWESSVKWTNKRTTFRHWNLFKQGEVMEKMNTSVCCGLEEKKTIPWSAWWSNPGARWYSPLY